MILEELRLTNYGVFRGEHRILLAPASAETPIILIGGLNGAGKTSILEAIRLALYGDRAELTKRGRHAYHRFLADMVSHGSERPESEVRLRFRTREEGRDCIYEVIRAWAVIRDGEVRESVVVQRDGVPDPTLSDHWHEEVERFIPRAIARLFLFDGEQIEQLADPETSAEVLRAALTGLLGIEIIDRLAADLQVLERRKRASNASPDQTDALDIAGARLEEATAELERAELARARLFTDSEKAREVHAATQSKFRSEGGHIFQSREQLVARRTELQSDRSRIEEELKSALAGPACLAMIEPLLREQLGAAERSAKFQVAIETVALLRDRDAALLDVMRQARAPQDIVTRTAEWLDEDLGSRVAESDRSGIALDARQAADLRVLLDERVPSSVAHIREVAGRLTAVTEELARVEREIDLVPAGDQIAELIADTERSALHLGRLEGQLAEAEEEVRRSRAELDHAESAYEAILEAVREADFAVKDDARLVTHASRARMTLAKLRAQILERRIAEIEDTVSSCLEILLRKDRLISRVTIEPESFALELFGFDGRAIKPHQLSAGERQILATALLWGLARVSGRPLPVVIDTPLGRLDGTHRDLFVERYLPDASHQVIVLVTDEETHPRHLAFLADRASRAYTLRYDDGLRSTTVTDADILAGVA